MFLVLLVPYILSIAPFSDETEDNRIVGGYPCSTEQYKFMVSLEKRRHPYHFCGGSLIRLDWVLTAAHCLSSFENAPNLITIAAGVNTQHRYGSQKRKAIRMFLHPAFEFSSMINDIALILLDSPFTRSFNVDIVDVVPTRIKGDVFHYCRNGIVLGFGITTVMDPGRTKGPEQTYVYKGNLSCVSIPIISDEDCQSLIPIPIIPSAFCATYLPGGIDACKGDSGGPFICRGFQIGIISSGFGCGMPLLPGFYTRLDRQLGFIKNTIKNNKPLERSFSSGCETKKNAIYWFAPLFFWFFKHVLHIIIL